MNSKSIILLLIAGLLSACASQPTEAPALPPTEVPATATELPTQTPPPTDTAVPTDTAISTETPLAEPTVISFAAEINPIIQSSCVICHGGSRGTEEGLDMTSYANIMAGSDNGPVITASNADGSLLVQMLVENKMPKRGPKLTSEQVQIITDWVNQGALNN